MAQTPVTINVTTGLASGEGSLAAAIAEANLIGGQVEILIASGLQILPSAQMIIALSPQNTGGITITGQGATIDMSYANFFVGPGGAGFAGDRAFFIASGNVSISNLNIVNGNAFGGQGMDAGGGGAGLGGAIFIANPAAIAVAGADSPYLNQPTNVTLTNVNFSNNKAVGGNVTKFYTAQTGGGGGMGGNSGIGYLEIIDKVGVYNTGGGGGGGFGVDATGSDAKGDPFAGSSGTFDVPFVPEDASSGGTGGEEGGAGGANGGGGGGGNAGSIYDGGNGAGGGGGIGGLAANGQNGGDGGFGGGGGGYGGDTGSDGDGGGTGGNGGFGGGGGVKGDGGFGGGAGMYGRNGFGGGVDVLPNQAGRGGGGGAGLGGALFVMDGATLTINQDSSQPGQAGFLGNSTLGGQPVGSTGTNAPIFGANGSAYGDDLFLGSDVTINVQTVLAMNALGGSGSTSDVNVTDHASDPNAVGGIIKTGTGTLYLNGNSYYSGTTVVHSGVVNFVGNPNADDAASETGTAEIIVGQQALDNAKLILAGNNRLELANFENGADVPIQIAQQTGSTGILFIGSGSGSQGADLNARFINGGAGTATLVFEQEYAYDATTPSEYEFHTALTGSLTVIQNGPGTTVLTPSSTPEGADFPSNTYTGETYVQEGTLIAASANALGGTSLVEIDDGGVFILRVSDAVNDDAAVTLNGGTIGIDGSSNGSITETFGSTSILTDSILDLGGDNPTLTFSSLTVDATLSIWNWDAGAHSLLVTSGVIGGNGSPILIYEDSGTHFLGYGALQDGAIVVVPEPQSLGVAGILAGLAAVGRRRGRVRGVKNAERS